MAKKNQVFKKYAPKFRLEIVWEAIKTDSKKVAKKYGVNINTINSWIRNYERGKLNTKKGPDSLKEENKQLREINRLQQDIIDALKSGDLTKLKKTYSINKICEVLRISKTTFYKWTKRGYSSKKDLQDEKDAKIIIKVFNENRKQYGYRRITKVINEELNLNWNCKKVLRIMEKYNIKANHVKRAEKTANLRKNIKREIVDYEDLVKRKYKEITKRFTVLYTDITQHKMDGKTFYQSTFLDGSTKEIVDVKISNKSGTELVVSGVDAAAKTIESLGHKAEGIIVHSDHGAEYTSKIYKQVVQDKLKMRISMGKKYTCADNVIIESFHSLLKKGTIYNNKYKDANEYIKDVFSWCNWYNTLYKKTNIKFCIPKINWNKK